MARIVRNIMLDDLPNITLRLGYVGENLHTQIVINAVEVYWDYPNATVQMVVQPPVGDVYEVTPDKDGSSLIWDVTGSDLVYAGTGRIQLTFADEGEVIKSAIGSFVVNASLEVSGDAPTPVQNWLDNANSVVSEAAETAAGAAAIEAAEAVRDSIPDDYTELSNSVDGLKDVVSGVTLVPVSYTEKSYINTNVNVGETVDLTPGATNYYDHAVVDCTEGTKVRVKATGGTSPKVLAFIDSNNVLLFKTTSTSVNSTYVAPANTAKVVLNAGRSGAYYAYVGKELDDKITKLSYDMTANLMFSGKNDMGWVGNWIRPEAVGFKRVRDKLYWAFTSHSGAKGIAEYDFNSGKISKRVLAKLNVSDLHNDLAIHILDDGTIIAAYSTGHNMDKNVRIRKSVSPESLEYFTDEIVLPCEGTTTYAQLMKSSNKLYLFYRTTDYKWAYRYSADDGDTWSDETILIVSDAQYYCLFAKTTTDSVIRVLSYTNPSASSSVRDTNIRQSFFHTDTNTLYNSDNATSLGASNVDKSNISILIANDATLTNQRLLDAAVSAIGSPMVLYAPFSNDNNAVYRLYNSGTITEFATAGTPLISGSYFLGASFLNTENIVAFVADNTSDYGAVYSISGSTVTEANRFYTEARGTLSIRNFYPICSEKAILWLRGVYGSTYTEFNSDAMIYLINEDRIVE